MFTTVFREMFQAIAVKTSGADTNLGTITYTNGSGLASIISGWPEGPKLSTDPVGSRGFSGEYRVTADNAQCYSTWDNSSGAASVTGVIRFFNWLQDKKTDGVHVNPFAYLQVSNGNTALGLETKTNGNYWYNISGSDTDSGIAIPATRQWVEYMLAFDQTAGNTAVKVGIYYRLLGSSSWVTILENLSYNIGGLGGTHILSNLVIGHRKFSGSATSNNMRFGALRLLGLDAWANRFGVDPNIVDPPAVFTYNDETTRPVVIIDLGAASGGNGAPATPFSPADFSIANQFCGVLAPAIPIVNIADGTAFDTTSDRVAAANALYGYTDTANVIHAPTAKYYGTRVNVLSKGGIEQRLLGSLTMYAEGQWLTSDQTIDQWDFKSTQTNLTHAQPISASAFTLEATGAGTVWKATLSPAKPSVVVWQNRIAMNHPTGANLAGVIASLIANQNSQWVNQAGDTVYINPVGGVDPTTLPDGTFENDQVSATGATLIVNNAKNSCVQGLRGSCTTLLSYNSNTPIGGYIFGGGSSLDGICSYFNLDAVLGDKHMIGHADNATGGTQIIMNCRASQGNPYGTQNPFVAYSGAAGGTLNNQLFMDGCSIPDGDTQTIGSAIPANLRLAASLVTHGNATKPYKNLTIQNCDFTNGGGLDVQYAPTEIKVIKTKMARLGSQEPSVIFEACEATRCVNFIGFYNDCYIHPSGETPNNSNPVFRLDLSNATMVQCTFDFRGLGGTVVMFHTSTTGKLNISESIVRLKTGQGLIDGGTTGDTLVFANNMYQLDGGATQNIVTAYNDGSTTAARTFAQWQTIGKDLGSVRLTDLGLDAFNHPLGTSPAIGNAPDRGPTYDAARKYWATRTTVGGFEGRKSSGGFGGLSMYSGKMY